MASAAGFKDSDKERHSPWTKTPGFRAFIRIILMLVVSNIIIDTIINIPVRMDIYTEEGHGTLLPAKGTVSGCVVLRAGLPPLGTRLNEAG